MAKEERKKPKQAIALEYDPSDEAPRVIASGRRKRRRRMYPSTGMTSWRIRCHAWRSET